MNVTHCPMCGSKVEELGMDEYNCDEHGSVFIEAWTYGPFNHS